MAGRNDRNLEEREAPTGVDSASLDALEHDGLSDHASYTEKELDEGGLDHLPDRFGEAKEAVTGVGDGSSDAPGHLLGPPGGGWSAPTRTTRAATAAGRAVTGRRPATRVMSLR